MNGGFINPGGIIGSTIEARGNVRAVYVHEADIKALGDVVVKKEIINSKINTSGEFNIKGGTILSSVVVAKKGIRASQIGSEISRPCRLMIGFDEKAINEIEKIKKAIWLKIEEKDELITRLKELAEITVKNKSENGELAQVQDQATEQISKIHQKISDCDAEVKEMAGQIEKNIEWSITEKGTPEVRVYGIIFQGTTISGIFSSLTLKQSYHDVLIKEHKIQGSDDMLGWQIKVSQLI